MTAPPLPRDAEVRSGLFNWLTPGQRVRCIQRKRVQENVVDPLSSSIDLSQVHVVARLVPRGSWTYFKVQGYDGIMFSAESAGDGEPLWEPVDE